MRGTEFAEMAAFVAIAERRSFAKAAMHLGVARSTLSQNIRALEERLRVRLLNRTTRSVSLTEAGEQMLARVRPALGELTAAANELDGFRHGPAGLLRIVVQPPVAKLSDGTSPRAVSCGISSHPIGHFRGQDAGQHHQ